MKMTYRDAINIVIRQEMEKDPKLFMIGEDVGPYGGEHGLSKGLWEQFGDLRMRDAPISEAGIVGLALGASITGCRAIAEIPFGDFLGCCMDQILNQAAKIRYMLGGNLDVKLVIRAPFGGYQNSAAQHSQSLEGLFEHIPGLLIAMPSNAAEAMGLLRTALKQNTCVMFFENKKLYQTKMEVPDQDYEIPFGVANTVKEGSDLTIVATAYMVKLAIEAAETLETEGVSVEIIDLRTLVPLDEHTIIKSVRKTGRLIVVNEGCKRGGVASEISAVVSEKAFHFLKKPIIRIAAENVPIPFSPPLEEFVLPSVNKIVDAARILIEKE